MSAEECRRSVIALLEEFYKVGYVGKSALDTHFGYGVGCGGEHNLGAHKSLLYDPTMWWHIEQSAELLLEGCQRTI